MILSGSVSTFMTEGLPEASARSRAGANSSGILNPFAVRAELPGDLGEVRIREGHAVSPSRVP